MFVNRWTDRYSPLRVAEGVDGAGAAAESAPSAAAAPAPAASEAAPAPAETVAAAPAAPAADAAAPAAAVAAETAESSPSLLESAKGRSDKAVDKAADPAPAKTDDTKSPEASKDAKAETPAPADAAKPEGDKAPDAKDAKAADAKEGDKPKDEAAKTDPAKDATAEAQPPAPIKYEAFKLPAEVKLDDKELGKFTEIVGAAQVKQEDAQKLVDLYVQDVQRVAQEIRAEQRKVWNTFNDSNKEELRKDPKLGGNRLETTLSRAKAVIEEYGGTREQVSDLLRHASNNGMGNYIGLVRLLDNVADALNIFENSIVPANPTAPKPQRGPGKRGWYAGMPDGGAATS